MKYLYRALFKGTYVSGKVEARSEQEVIEYLRGMEYMPVRIHPDDSLWAKYISRIFDHVSFDDIINFTREFAIMLNAGLTITSSLDILVEQASKSSLRTMYNRILTSIKAGDNFSKAVSEQRHFSRLYVALIKAGEASGKLNDVMLRMADDLEKQRAFMSKVRGTMVYPVIVLTGVAGVLVIMLVYVIPQLSTLYRDLGVDLPLSTQILIASSDFLVAYWPILLVLILVSAVIIRRLFRNERFKILFDEALIRIPKFGDIIVKATLVDLTSTLSLLIQSGVLMLESLSIVSNTTGNLLFQKSMRSVYLSVQNGNTLSKSFEKEEIFPPILVQMVAVGERTGRLDEVVKKVSDYFQMQTDAAIKTVTTLIEPLTLVLLGVVVLVVVMSVLTPIYTLTTSIGQ